MGVKVHIIEPAGFRLDEKAFRRAGMDYVEQAAMQKHLNWSEFEAWRKQKNRRSLLLTTKGTQAYTDFKYEDSDLIMLGRESIGAPDYVHEAVNNRLTIPMAGEARSLNMALTGAMVLGEAIRQVG